MNNLNGLHNSNSTTIRMSFAAYILLAVALIEIIMLFVFALTVKNYNCQKQKFDETKDCLKAQERVISKYNRIRGEAYSEPEYLNSGTEFYSMVFESLKKHKIADSNITDAGVSRENDKSSEYKIHGLNITGNGGYKELINFISDITTNKYFIKTSKVDIKRDALNNVKFTVVLQRLVYSASENSKGGSETR